MRSRRWHSPSAGPAPVTITGRPQAMASTTGRPNPSPRNGCTRQSQAAYSPAISASVTLRSTYSTR